VGSMRSRACAGLLVRAHHVRTLLRQCRRSQIRVAQPRHRLLVADRILPLVLRREPVAAQVWSQVDLAKKRRTCRTEILATIPRLMTSTVRSPIAQCDVGQPLSLGGSQATAMIDATCSGVNVGGAPLRASSASNPVSNSSSSPPMPPGAPPPTAAQQPRTSAHATAESVGGPPQVGVPARLS